MTCASPICNNSAHFLYKGERFANFINDPIMTKLNLQRIVRNRIAQLKAVKEGDE